jgi:GNAT superfamily N-acetyltransferase
MTVTVRRMHDSDLASVVAAMGQRHYFADRLARQAAGLGVVLLALDGGNVVGDVYVWLSPADEPELRRHLSGVPLLNHLEVLPARQSRGIGTRIIAAAERTVYDLAYRRLALGVGIDNPRARNSMSGSEMSTGATAPWTPATTSTAPTAASTRSTRRSPYSSRICSPPAAS